MAFDFGALLTGVNRGFAGYRAGQMQGEDERFAREQEMAEQKRRENAELFSQWAREQQLRHSQAQLDALERDRRERRVDADDNRNRLNTNDQRTAIEKGWQAAPVEGAAPMIDATTRALGFGSAMGGMRAPNQERFKQNVRGVPIEADEAGPVQYAQVGGRAMRYDPQALANSAAREEAQRLLGRFRERDMMEQGGPPSPGRTTVSQRTAMAQYELMKPAYDRLKQKFDEGWTPSKMDKFGESIKAGWMPDVIGNVVQSDEGQQTYDDLTSIVLGSQYALSGKAVTEGEARKLARGLMPQLGDKPDRAAQKRAEIGTRLRVVLAAMGQLDNEVEPAPPRAGPPNDDDIDARAAALLQRIRNNPP